MKDDLAGDRFWRYERQASPGLQEFIEALSFAHYLGTSCILIFLNVRAAVNIDHFLEHGTLITLSQIQQTLCDPDGIPVRNVPMDLAAP